MEVILNLLEGIMKSIVIFVENPDYVESFMNWSIITAWFSAGVSTEFLKLIADIYQILVG